VVRGALVIVLLASTAAHAEPMPIDWLTTEAVMGEAPAGHEKWGCYGFGFAMSHVFVGHLELGVEAQAMNLDASKMDDLRHGFALRSGASIGYRFQLSDWGGFAWDLGPEVGVATAVAFGLGVSDRTTDEVFGGVRASIRIAAPGRAGNSRGWGASFGFRIARTDAELTGTLVIGYDWGL
jgi:hypothetical protein